MVAKTSQLILQYRWPLLLITVAFVVYSLPGLASILIYDRQAILSGEIWRIVTGHWVHFSFLHLFWDAVTLGVSAVFIQRFQYGYLLLLSLSSAAVIGILMLILLPHMPYYGGLSGVAMATLVYLLLCNLERKPAWRSVSLMMIALVIFKMIYEVSTLEYLLLGDMRTVIPVPLSHMLGAICAIVLFFATSQRQNIHSSCDV